MVNWGDIYEVIYLCSADTLMADAFRRAVGLPTKHRCNHRIAYDRKSVYADIDFERLMKQPYGVRM